MKKLLILSMCVLSLISLTACNTMQGLGKDVQKVGSSVENAAKK